MTVIFIIFIKQTLFLDSFHTYYKLFVSMHSEREKYNVEIS